MQLPQAGDLSAIRVLITQVFTTAAGGSVLIGHCLGTLNLGIIPILLFLNPLLKQSFFIFPNQKNLSYQNIGSSRIVSKTGGRGEGDEKKKDILYLKPNGDHVFYTGDFLYTWACVRFSFVHL